LTSPSVEVYVLLWRWKHASTVAERAKRYEEVVLWFDACLFDQTIMIHLIDRLSELELGETKLSLICAGEFPGFELFNGFAELNSEQMASLLEARHELTRAEIELAIRAMAAV